MQWIAIAALACASIALVLSGWNFYLLRNLSSAPAQAPVVPAADPAAALTDAALVWQQLVIECDEVNGESAHSLVNPQVKTAVVDWITQLRDFCFRSRSEADQVYQITINEVRSGVDPHLPDLDRYNKETRSNVAVIADQLAHLRKVLRGREPLRQHQFKVTLHRGQVLAHYLARRKKLAELKLNRGKNAA